MSTALAQAQFVDATVRQRKEALSAAFEEARATEGAARAIAGASGDGPILGADLKQGKLLEDRLEQVLDGTVALLNAVENVTASGGRMSAGSRILVAATLVLIGAAMSNANAVPAVARATDSSRVSMDGSVSYVRLKPPFSLGGETEFEVFLDLALNFVCGEPFQTQVRVLRSLIAADTYKLCAKAFDEAKELSELVKSLKNILGTTKNTAMYVDKFLECRQTATESIQKYAGRLRLLAIEAYPKSTPDESFMIHQFIRGLKLDRISRNMINTTQPATLNEAIAITSHITTESLEVHFAEMSKQTTQYVRQVPYKGRVTRDV